MKSIICLIVSMFFLSACGHSQVPHLKSYKAQFTQKQFSDVNTAISGELFYMYPHYYKVVAHYNDDANNQIINIKNGTQSISYSNQLNLVIETNVREDENKFLKKHGYAPNYITDDNLKYIKDDLFNNENVKMYEARVSESIRTQEPQAPTRIVYYFSVRDNIPVRIEYYDVHDKITETIENTILERNVELEKNDFNFEIPTGTRVVKQ